MKTIKSNCTDAELSAAVAANLMPDDFEKSEAVRKHTKCRGKNVTTRWQLVAQDLFIDNQKLLAENDRHKKRMEWYEDRLCDKAGNA